MKARGFNFLFIFLILLLLLFPVISSVKIDMDSEYAQGETLITKISGNFLEPPSKGATKLYRGHVRVSFDPYMAKINYDYYIYASLSDREKGNYSLVIEDVRYYSGNEISDDNLIKNFSITDKTADFSLSPGFVITKEDFYLDLQNLGDNELEISIKTGAEPDEEEDFFSSLFGSSDANEESYSLTLKPGEKEKIKFKIGNMEKPHFELINIKSDNTSYNVPLYVFGEEEEKEKREFRIEPETLNITLSTGSNTSRVLYLYNDGADLENISVSVSSSLKPYVSLDKSKIPFLSSDSKEKINVLVISGDDEKEIEGQISVSFNNSYIYSAVFLNFLKDYQPEENITDYTEKTCSEREGEICKDYEECEGEKVIAKDDICCLGDCVEKKESSSAGKITGWLLIILIAGFLVWFYLKTKKRKK